MIDDHICDGDYVIIKPQSTCLNGDIVVATHIQDGVSMVSRSVKTQKEGSIRATFLLSTPVFSTLFAQTFWKYTSAGV